MIRPFLIATALLLAVALPVRAGELKQTKRVEPQYPVEAARSGTVGYVDVEFVVDAAGKVTAVSVTGAKPVRTFEQSAVRAVKQWQFAPGTGGKGKVRLNFTL